MSNELEITQLENCVCEKCEQLTMCEMGETDGLDSEKCGCKTCLDTEKCDALLKQEMLEAQKAFTLSLYLDEGVDTEIVRELIEGIRKANDPYEITHREAFVPEIGEEYMCKRYDRIVLHINSGGGYLHDGMALVNEILNSKIPVECRITNAHSMAFIIAIACHKRSIYRMGNMMYHDVKYGGYGTREEQLDELSLVSSHIDMVEEFIASRTNLSRAELKRIRKNKKDKYYHAKEAYEKGLVDEII